jgi:PTS system glucitol/sorbitol-specific IIA component
VVVYSSKIVKIGDQAHLFLEEGIVVFFGDNAPEELQDVAVVHELQEVVGEIAVGTKINLSNEELIVTAVGPVANENFVNLGHLVLKLDSATEAALPGDVSCSYTNVPEIKIDDRIEIN